jgi:long-subunit acyl-CoA synthetase (AMP-forming)
MPDRSLIGGIPFESATLGQTFRRLAETYADQVVLRTIDDSVSLTWKELLQRVDALAGGLAKLGLRRGDTIALMLSNRPEFHLVDLAAVTLGATPFSIYQTLSPEQIQYVVSDAGAKIAVVETAYLDAFLEAKANLPNVEHVVVIDGNGEGGTLKLSDVEGAQPDFDAAAHAAAVQPEDLLTLIYTSGTTGPPKGVQLSHRNLFSVVKAVTEVVELPPRSRVISWLPTAHIAERALNYYWPFLYGATITCCANPREIVSYLPKVRPTFFFAVPRIWEKLKAGLEAQLANLPEEQRNVMRAGIDAALDRVRLTQSGKPVPADLEQRVAQADTAFFAGVRDMVGLDQATLVLVGAAPTPRDVLEFFHALGIPLAEGWGMSETSAIGTINPPGKIRIGSVGIPAPGIELKLAEDGELLIRGANIMVGYRNLPDKTAEAIDADGWLATGDVAQIDADGYVKIVDRKKELIINAAGKNMSPANIESTIKGGSPLIGQVCVIGDARSYNTALIVLDADFAAVWAKQNGMEGMSLSDLATEEKVRAAVQEGVDQANKRLARVEQIKKFTIIPGDWAPGGDELTPTMKLKRKPIGAKYTAEIEAMYR